MKSRWFRKHVVQTGNVRNQGLLVRFRGVNICNCPSTSSKSVKTSPNNYLQDLEDESLRIPARQCGTWNLDDRGFHGSLTNANPLNQA
jgi:hypothetical protein